MDQSSQTLSIGSELHHYQIQSILGEGGFGVTYKAFNTRIKQTVAIKEFLPADLAFRETGTTQVYARSEGKQQEFDYGLKKFLEEAQTLAQFNHPNIVRAYDFFEENGTGYLVMEYADGQSLNELIKAGGPLSEEKITHYFMPLLDGLEEVHKVGLLHRDIKPDNIYIRSNGNSLLIDFGAARQAVGQHSKSVTGIVSQGYAPTEQYGTNSKKQGPWTDLYAVGATLYKCISAKTPIDAPTRRDDIHDEGIDPLMPASELGKGRYSQALLDAIDQCLHVAIKQRPQNVHAVKELFDGSQREDSFSGNENNKTRRIDEEEAGFDRTDDKSRTFDEENSDFFQNSSSKKKGADARKSVTKGQDLSYTLELTLIEALQGLTSEIIVPAQRACQSCTVDTRAQCHQCHGTGLKEKTSTLKVKVPAGVDTDDVIRLEGQGDASPNGGANGDLYVKFKVGDHEGIKRVGNDLHTSLPIAPNLGFKGGEVVVESPLGKLKLKVPAQAYHGKVLRLKGQGVTPIKGGDKGDMLITLAFTGYGADTATNAKSDNLYKINKIGARTGLIFSIACLLFFEFLFFKNRYDFDEPLNYLLYASIFGSISFGYYALFSIMSRYHGKLNDLTTMIKIGIAFGVLGISGKYMAIGKDRFEDYFSLVMVVFSIAQAFFFLLKKPSQNP